MRITAVHVYFLFFYIISFSKAEEIQLSSMTFDLDFPIHYETCSCTNNTYTQHIAEPYWSEIETWFVQTGEDVQLSTQQFLCSDCDIRRRFGFLKGLTTVVNSISDWFTNFFEEEKEIIHPLCFQMGRKLVDKKGSNKQFFSCVHSHYDGSNEDQLCRNTSPDPTAPKQCIAVPISCKDVQNVELTCLPEIENRPDNFKSDGCNRGASYPRRPCFNQIYTAMTMKAFYDVTQCLDVDDRLAFSTLFHESRFILNIKSHTGALCYGQVTGQAVADFNSLLEGSLYSQLSSFVETSRCPQVWTHFNKIQTHTVLGKKKIQSPLSRCHLSLNPYTCLFYSIGYLKILTHLMEDTVQRENKIMRLKQHNGWIMFWDGESDLKSQAESSKIEKMNIFKDELSLINILTVFSYNGGPGIRVQFKKYIRSLKENLQEDENLRKTFFEDGLGIDYFKETFTDFLSKRYLSGKRGEEVSGFLNKIEQDTARLNQFIKTQYPEIEEDMDCTPKIGQILRRV